MGKKSEIFVVLGKRIKGNRFVRNVKVEHLILGKPVKKEHPVSREPATKPYRIKTPKNLRDKKVKNVPLSRINELNLT